MNFKSILKHLAAHSKHCTAIILAAGSGSRMGANTTKQLMMIDGMPVVARSIAVFESCKSIKDIVVVAKKEEVALYSEMIKKYNFKKISRVVPGGNTRQESVMCGFRTLTDKSDYVAIHDAARCLITAENIEKVLREAVLYGAASAACPVKDTVKIINKKGFVASTPPRNYTWAAQTPQIFKADLYRAAAFTALKEGFEATDDNSLVEWLGHRVKLVDCGYRNIKITTPEDLHIAQVLLKEQKNV